MAQLDLAQVSGLNRALYGCGDFLNAQEEARWLQRTLERASCAFGMRVDYASARELLLHCV